MMDMEGGQPVGIDELRFIEPGQLRDVWHMVRQEVTDIGARSDMMQEEVFFAIRNAAAALFIAFHAGRKVGWFVSYRENRVNGDVMHIWMANCRPEHTMSFWEMIVEMAVKAGVRKIQFASNRKGWSRLIEKFGATKTHDIYEVQL